MMIKHEKLKWRENYSLVASKMWRLFHIFHIGSSDRWKFVLGWTVHSLSYICDEHEASTWQQQRVHRQSVESCHLRYEKIKKIVHSKINVVIFRLKRIKLKAFETFFILYTAPIYLFWVRGGGGEKDKLECFSRASIYVVLIVRCWGERKVEWRSDAKWEKIWQNIFA